MLRGRSTLLQLVVRQSLGILPSSQGIFGLPRITLLDASGPSIDGPVFFRESNIQRRCEKHRGGPALALRNHTMAATFASAETREILRCHNPQCNLMQFRATDSLCRKCRRPLGVEVSASSAPQAVERHATFGRRVADQVREIRRARHLSQRQLASRMQVPRTYISKIENGRALPTLGSLERLATALQVQMRRLIPDPQSRREEETAAILADPFIAEIASMLPKIDTLHRRLIFVSVRDMVSNQCRTA
jgi:transcriptional regulator with XRE-family HTH domain